MTAKELIEVRERLGLSPKQLSKRIGVTQGTVNRWEREGLPEGPESRLLRVMQGLAYIDRSIKRDEV
jgi:DNA-binding transcriptional regulator YiaG